MKMWTGKSETKLRNMSAVWICWFRECDTKQREQFTEAATCMLCYRPCEGKQQIKKKIKIKKSFQFRGRLTPRRSFNISSKTVQINSLSCEWLAIIWVDQEMIWIREFERSNVKWTFYEIILQQFYIYWSVCSLRFGAGLIKFTKLRGLQISY